MASSVYKNAIYKTFIAHNTYQPQSQTIIAHPHILIKHQQISFLFWQSIKLHNPNTKPVWTTTALSNSKLDSTTICIVKYKLNLNTGNVYQVAISKYIKKIWEWEIFERLLWTAVLLARMPVHKRKLLKSHDFRWRKHDSSDIIVMNTWLNTLAWSSSTRSFPTNYSKIK